MEVCVSMEGASGFGEDSTDKSLSPQSALGPLCFDHHQVLGGSREVLGSLKTWKNMAELLSEHASPILAVLRMGLPSGNLGVLLR